MSTNKWQWEERTTVQTTAFLAHGGSLELLGTPRTCRLMLARAACSRAASKTCQPLREATQGPSKKDAGLLCPLPVMGWHRQLGHREVPRVGTPQCDLMTMCTQMAHQLGLPSLQPAPAQ